MNDTLRNIALWHERARPDPTVDKLGVQIGCHAEEFCEMLRALEPTQAIKDAAKAVEYLADLWKSGAHYPMIADRRELLDSLADQIVTAVGVGHCARMDVTEACKVVNFSNWSKFDHNGQPVFNEAGKIKKGPDYAPPDLSGLY